MRATNLTLLLVCSVSSALTVAQPSAQRETQQLRVGGRVGSVAVADLNGDQRPDIVAARIDAGTASVFLGVGRGAFSEATGSPFSVGDNPEDLAVGDFDSDGKLDLVVANHETTHLTLLLGDGDGGFAPASQSQIPIPSRPHAHGVAAGDFNGDSHLDVAVESRDDDVVMVKYGNARGGFAAEPVRVRVGRGPYWKLRSGDLNGDGRADLVTTDNEGSTVSVVLADRGGAFRRANQIAINRAPFAIAIGDVNADRRPDLAIVHRRGDSNPALDALTVLLGDGAGDFVAASAASPAIGMSPTAVAIGDFDGDGIGDIAIAGMASNDVTIVRGGRPGLQAQSTSRFAVGQGPTAIASGDFNGDGKADIVTGNWGSGDVSVALSP